MADKYYSDDADWLDFSKPFMRPDPELKRFLEEYDATHGRMYQHYDQTDRPTSPGSLPPIRPKYYGRKPSQKLAQARASTGFTQKELATRIGTTRRTIVAIETGQRTPSVYMAIAIAQALGIKVEDIFHLPPLTPVPPSRY